MNRRPVAAPRLFSLGALLLSAASACGPAFEPVRQASATTSADAGKPTSDSPDASTPIVDPSISPDTPTESVSSAASSDQDAGA